MEKTTEIWALTIDNKKPSDQIAGPFDFEPHFVQVLLSGLHTIYSEVFVWSVKNHLALWVTGNDVSFLMGTFMNHLHHFEKIQLFRGEKAKDYLSNIGHGLAWQDCSMTDKLRTFKEAYLYAHIHGQLGFKLAPFIEECLKVQINHPLIKQVQNSWNGSNAYLDVDGIQVEAKKLFSRFCLN